MKTNIAVVAGGYSSEYIVSLKSAEGILSFLDKKKYSVYIVLITKEKWTVKLSETQETEIDRNDFSFKKNGKRVKFDFAYITIHGAPGEDGRLQGYFDIIGIPYSCCGTLAASLSFNKFFCKKYLEGFGVKTAKAILLKRDTICPPKQIAEALGLPLFVKPNDGGSSFGTTKVNKAELIQEAIDKAFEEGNEVIVEQFVAGTEITCGCFHTDRIIVLPVTEVVSKNEFFDFEAKYTASKVDEITPARISEQKTREVQELTANIYHWLGAKGIIRVDYILTNNGEIALLEVNTTPGMTQTSFIPQQIRAGELDITEVLTDIIEKELHARPTPSSLITKH